MDRWTAQMLKFSRYMRGRGWTVPFIFRGQVLSGGANDNQWKYQTGGN